MKDSDLREIMSETANKLKSYGYDVYLSHNGFYGFYTDKVICISFNYSLGGFLSFSSNYKQSKYHGTGKMLLDGITEISKNEAKKLIDSCYAQMSDNLPMFISPEQKISIFQSSGYVQI